MTDHGAVLCIKRYKGWIVSFSPWALRLRVHIRCIRPLLRVTAGIRGGGVHYLGGFGSL